MQWNYRQLDWPDLESVAYFFKYSLWFAWPAWPFAAWAVYAWRKQEKALHIAVPLCFLLTFTLLAFLDRHSEEGILLPLLPPLAILAAFGLPTMKRSAINAVDWFSVMVLTGIAAAIWIGWMADQLGWPASLAQKVGKLAPGYVPEFHPFAFLVAFASSVAWFRLVYWRISRQPAVLWRAVVLSSGGVVLCWVLLMTLWLPWANQRTSYAGVAQDMRHQIDAKLPHGYRCIESNVDPAQRASFAYFGDLHFSGFADQDCDLKLVQTSRHAHQKDTSAGTHQDLEPAGHWERIWQGRRPHDKDESFALYLRKQP
jgi:4-amino-4-deoxy-L-arabinose transferase-like glycosyltransferase